MIAKNTASAHIRRDKKTRPSRICLAHGLAQTRRMYCHAREKPERMSPAMTTGSENAVAPVFSAAPHIIDDSGAMVGWFIEPAGVLMQLVRRTRGTVQMAEWLVGYGLDRLLQRFAGRRGLRVILDMREMTGRSASARALLIASATRALPRIGHVVVLPSRHMGEEYVTVVEVTARVVSAMGLRVDVEHDMDKVIARHAIRLGAPRAAEPGSLLTR
jgi:hypothetical protein